MVRRSKFFIKMISRTQPAKQLLHFWAMAPNKRPPMSAISTGACMLPGPFSLLTNSVVVRLKTKSTTMAMGRTVPEALSTV